MMRRPVAKLLAAGFAAAAMSVGASAAAPAPPSDRQPVAPPTRAALEESAFRLKILMGALQSSQLDEPIKNVLYLCLYENPFKEISEETGRVLRANNLDVTDPNKVLTVMAGVCGLRPDAASAAPSAPSPKSGTTEKPNR